MHSTGGYAPIQRGEGTHGEGCEHVERNGRVDRHSDVNADWHVE